ncbi:MAG TPA: low temperature requirement protein A, partial [Rugosimonospora sp.]|nr:low temperature requirement protein A [Rugosimonospora sp.]
ELRERLRGRRKGVTVPARRDLLRSQFAPPRDPAHAVDAEHLAERFGLFMIILLGEIVISVGTGALDSAHEDLAYWLSVGGGLVLAGALWWVYFTSAAEMNRRLLAASGGNPLLAHTLYAGGHLVPAFSLLVIAAGVTLSLRDHPPGVASWLVTCGLAGYLAGTRVLAAMRHRWYAGLLRIVLLAATVCLALLGRVLIQPAVVAVAAGWALGAALAVSALQPVLRRLGGDPLRHLRAR